jgi:hypothetical protein
MFRSSGFDTVVQSGFQAGAKAMSSVNQSGFFIITIDDHLALCAKNLRLVYNRTGRFSALTGNRDRTVPGGTASEAR